MDLSILSNTLKRAAGVLKAAGAKQQTAAVEAVEALVEAAPHQTVEQFVDHAVEELRKPDLKDLPAEEVAAQLRAAKDDRVKFDKLFQSLGSKSFTKDKVIAVAALYTGARKSAWSTKPKALKAIQAKFNETIYLSAKASVNEKVTPW